MKLGGGQNLILDRIMDRELSFFLDTSNQNPLDFILYNIQRIVVVIQRTKPLGLESKILIGLSEH